MDFFDLYNWLLPDQATYMNKYANNDALYNMAQALWSEMETSALTFFILAVIIGVLFAIVYYYGITQFAHRMYKMRYWFVFLIITFVIGGLATYIMGSAEITTNLDERIGFLCRLVFINCGYATIVYLIMSVICCYLPIPTNAYRFFKIK